MKHLVTLTAGALLLATSTAAAPVDLRGMNSYTGTLYDRESGKLELVLHPGTTYTYRGACDLNCQDLDFALYRWVPPYNGRRGYWKFIIADRGPDDTPVVWVTPDFDATYRMEIIMSRCSYEPCDYSVDLSW